VREYKGRGGERGGGKRGCYERERTHEKDTGVFEQVGETEREKDGKVRGAQERE